MRQHSNFRGVKMPFRRWLSVILGASKCQYKGGFARGTGRVAYFRTRAVWGVRETPLDWCFHATCAWRTRISANISRLAKRPTQLLSQSILKIFVPCTVFLGASKCFHKGGFPVRTGRVAYFRTRAVWAYRETPLGKYFHAPSKTTCATDTPRGLACPRRGRTTPS